MTNIVRVSSQELTAREIVAIVDRGGRVIIQTPILGTTKDVVIRKHKGTYYCDTPMKLLTHERTDEIIDCLEHFDLARPASDTQSESPTPAPADS